MDSTPRDADRGTLISPGSPATLVGDAPSRIGDYSVIRKLGEGGMGAVWLAEDPKLGRKVAIKTMRPEIAANSVDRDRFLREAKAAAAVENDHIVPIWSVGEAADGTPFIAMPFLQGESLSERLKREPVSSRELLLKVASEVAEGLAAAHAAGLVHRDIKPANIWLEGEPGKEPRRCKILDFGLARPVTGGGEQLTASGAILGTPAFMAPEQARGEAIDARADLFSLGVTLWRMAAGKQPFDGPTPMAVLIALTTDSPPKLRIAAPRIPADIANLIDRLMAKEPGNRPWSAAEVVSELHRISPEETSSKRSRVPLILGVVAAIALVGVIAFLVTRGDKPADTVAKGNDAQPVNTPKDPPKQGGPKPVEPPKKDKPLAEGEADRKAALWVLEKKGAVQVDVETEQIRDAAKLPKEPFKLQQVYLSEPVTDAALAVFDECRDLEIAYLVGTGIRNAALLHFANCTNLTSLSLPGTKVDDEAAPIIVKFRKLTDLSIGATDITHKGAKEIAKKLPLCRIQYGATFEPATDDDRTAAEFVLSLGGKVGADYADTESGDKLPKDAFRLTSVDLTGVKKMTDDELDRFNPCKSLMKLVLADTPVGDKGLETIKGLAKLTHLDLRKSKVSVKAAKTVSEALPECEVLWDGGSYRPKK